MFTTYVKVIMDNAERYLINYFLKTIACVYRTDMSKSQSSQAQSVHIVLKNRKFFYSRIKQCNPQSHLL